MWSFLYCDIPCAGKITATAVSPTGTYLAIALDTHNLLVYRLADKRLVITFQEFTRGIASLLFSPNESLLAIGTLGGAVHVYDIKEDKQILKLAVHRTCVTAFAFTPSGLFLASGSLDGQVYILDLEKGSKFQEFGTSNPILIRQADKPVNSTVSNPAITALAFIPNGTWLIVGGVTGRIIIWNTTTKKVIRELAEQQQDRSDDLERSTGDSQLLQTTTGTVRQIVVHPVERVIGVCDGVRVSFWDLGQFNQITQTPKRTGGYNDLLFMEEGTKCLAIHSRGMAILDYDIPEQPVLNTVAVTLDGHATSAIRPGGTAPQVVNLCIYPGDRSVLNIWVIKLKFIEPFKSIYDQGQANVGPKQEKEVEKLEKFEKLEKPRSSTPKSGLKREDARASRPPPDDRSKSRDMQPHGGVTSMFDPAKIDSSMGFTPEMQAAMLGHAEVLDAVTMKSELLSFFTEQWQLGNFRSAFETLAHEGDVRLVCDVLKKVDLRQGVAVGDLTVVLPLLARAIEKVATPREVSIRASALATDAMKLAVGFGKTFKSAVFDTIRAYRISGGKDFALEDRYLNCRRFYDGLCEIATRCESAEMQSTSSATKSTARSTALQLRDGGYNERLEG
ncbi:WD40 repeat protein [Giardia muris]|uniref:WD40 repeat protein n=1 Tax=Giardia muris TaxID=5742 RepID=A0A4Z1SXM3_GIAMU|nr:WD40 repeat protein [Giardia muris]|eukprot:TNJ29565.1 WD40 repeat protein [Giardia muris]